MSDAIKEFDMALDHMKKTSRDLWDYAHEKREDVVAAQVQTDVALAILAEVCMDPGATGSMLWFVKEEVAKMQPREREVFAKLIGAAPREG